MSSVETPDSLSIGITQVSRYHALAETAGGFELPDAQSTDRHFFFSLPEAERSWHEIIPATTPAGPTLRAGTNELVFFARNGSVIFGDVVILYTSDRATVPIRVGTATQTQPPGPGD